MSTGTFYSPKSHRLNISGNENNRNHCNLPRKDLTFSGAKSGIEFKVSNLEPKIRQIMLDDQVYVENTFSQVKRRYYKES
jgi:hypothetical protein